MKIEPTLDVLRHPFIDGDVLFFRNLPIAAGDKLYTEAQLRQLGEACAAVCDDDVTVDRIRELVKEMLG